MLLFIRVRHTWYLSSYCLTADSTGLNQSINQSALLLSSSLLLLRVFILLDRFHVNVIMIMCSCV